MPTLEWRGKKAVEGHHLEVPFRLLRRNEDLSFGQSDTGNLLVYGDNLSALKALLPYYAGQVKCIYIDPPYNTGNEGWRYNDNVNSVEIQEWLGQVVGKEGEDLSRHDKWLCMMYPRLSLLAEFLREDGVIFVSIDDNEIANLKLLMHTIFGEQNFIATLVWEKGKKGDSSFFSVTHEYILVATKNKSALVDKKHKWRRKKPGVDQVLSYYSELREKNGDNHAAIRKDIMRWYRLLPKGHPAKAHKHYNWSDDRGLYFASDFSGPDDGRENRPRYEIIHPLTKKPCAKPSTGWRWEEERTLSALSENPPRIHFGPDETTIPCRKSYLVEIDKEPFTSVFYKDGRAATLEVEQLIGPGKFQFPKDSEVLADLIGLVCEKDDLVLDSFAGSGTTAHAVLRLNNSDNGNRRFVLIEMERYICENVTRNRLINVITGQTARIRSDTSDTLELPSRMGGFSYCELGFTLCDTSGQIREEVTFGDLARHVFFVETGKPISNPLDGQTPLIGISKGVAIYLLYNGVLKDKSPLGGNVLTSMVLAALPPHEGPKIIYGTGCRLSPHRLKQERIIFRQIPYEVRVG